MEKILWKCYQWIVFGLYLKIIKGKKTKKINKNWIAVQSNLSNTDTSITDSVQWHDKIPTYFH